MHHVIRRSQGGSDEESNLVPLCHDCHMAHHDGRKMLEFFLENPGEPLLVREPGEDHWHLCVEYNEFSQAIPFSEGEPDDGDAIHECLSRLTQAAQTASTLDYVVGVVLEELAPLVTTEELYDAVEEAFGIARATTPSFISRRRKYARLGEEYADLGLSRGLALLDAEEKTGKPIEYLAPDIRALTVSDFKIRHGLKPEPKQTKACPVCGKQHVCECKEEK